MTKGEASQYVGGGGGVVVVVVVGLTSTNTSTGDDLTSVEGRVMSASLKPTLTLYPPSALNSTARSMYVYPSSSAVTEEEAKSTTKSPLLVAFEDTSM
jgi:hypothetical protein